MSLSTGNQPQSFHPLAGKLRALADDILKLVTDYESAASGLEASEALLHLRQSAARLDKATTSPSDLEMTFHYQPHQNACVRMAIELGIFNHVPSEEGHLISVEALTAQVNTDPEFTTRIVRALCASGILEESQSQNGDIMVQSTELSRLWCQPAAQAYAKHQWDNVVISLVSMIPFLRQHGLSSPSDASNTPFAYALGAENVGFFNLLQRYPERLESFNRGMTGTTISVVSTYPFGTLSHTASADPRVVLVDVGGGKGHTTQEIRSAYPELKGTFVLQDLEAVVAQDLEVDPQKVQVQAYNFLTQEQSVKGAAAYLFKAIFHDWPDSDCRQILRNLAPAMLGYDSRLLICDIVIGPLASSQPYKVMRDINMMIMAGKERSVHQWQELLESEGFRIVKIWGLDNPANSVIEAVLMAS